MLWSLLLGCGVSEARFAEAYARAQCDQEQRCHLAEFETSYSSLEDCIFDATVDEVEIPEDCDYDSSAANDCLSALRSADCTGYDVGEWADECEAIYVCDDGNLAGGPMSEAQFAKLYQEQLCDMIVELDCGQPCVDPTGTTTSFTDTETFYCVFDAAAAADCINGQWTCTDFGGGFLFPEGPGACFDVYTCTGSSTNTTGTTVTF